MRSFGEKLKKARELKRLGQKQVQELTGINYKTVSNYETNRCEPSIENISILCDLYGIFPNDLIPVKADTSMQLSDDEREVIRVFRSLDNHGRDIIKTICSKESDRLIREYQIEKAKMLLDKMDSEEHVAASDIKISEKK